MKKVRVLLQVLAVVFAAGSAFAFSASPAQQGYVKVTDFPFCQTSISCNGSGAACKDASGNLLYDGTTINASTCGVSLQRNP